MSDLERWRQLFREEAQRCVKELREVIEQDGRGVMARHPIRHLMRLMHTYAYLCNMFSIFFKFLQDPVLSLGWRIWMLYHIASCYLHHATSS